MLYMIRLRCREEGMLKSRIETDEMDMTADADSDKVIMLIVMEADLVTV